MILALETTGARDRRPARGPRRPVVCGLAAAVALVAAAGSTAQEAPSLGVDEIASIGIEEIAAIGVEEAAAIGIEEIVRGQRGYGVSVFAGTEPERFDVEVVGVLRDMSPGVSFILARLSGQGLENTGVIAGMSGSPVYIDDRLAGAVAFSWNFASDAIAGITPISQMRRLSGLPDAGPAPRSVGSLGSSNTLLDLVAGRPGRGTADPAAPAQILREQLGAAVATSALGRQPSVAFAASGFGDSVREILGSALAPLGPLAAAGRAESGVDLGALRAGSSVAGLLVGGDLELAVSGTVTEVRKDQERGDEVLAFGHAFLSIGPLRMPLAPAEVVSVVPSRFSSFKLTNVGPVIGAFDQDRLAGLRGRIGLEAKTTPMEIRVRGVAERDYHLEIADIPAMRPGLVGVSALQALDAAARSNGDLGVDLRMRFDLSDLGILELRQTFDGSGAGVDAAVYLLQLVGYLELNPWVDIDVASIAIDLQVAEQPRSATIEAVHPSRRQVAAGEAIDLRLELVGYRGERFSRTAAIVIPSDARRGNYHLFVGDGMSVDAARLRIEPGEPKDFGAALRQLASYHARDQLVILGVRPSDPGLAVSGRSLPSLPGSIRAIWEGADQVDTRRLGLAIRQQVILPFERPLDGIVRVDLEIVEPRTGSSQSRSSRTGRPGG